MRPSSYKLKYKAENAPKVEDRGRKGENIQLSQLWLNMLPWDLILSYLQEKTYDSWVLNDRVITHLWNKKVDTFYGIFINNDYFPIFVNTEQRHAAVIKLSACVASVQTFWEVFSVKWLFLFSSFILHGVPLIACAEL